MGQGFSLATPSAGSASIDVPELGDLVYEKSIGNARFMKSVRARHHDGVVLVKILVKPYTPMPLEKYRKEIIEQRKALADVPNALPFQRVIETETNGYLVRQYMYSSLYDRISTRPFLEDIEKKWLAFQLLCALRDCHARDIYHGDIKAQNILVTSWNWLYLTDFSSAFKPIVLPDDNPGDFTYYFDTAGTSKADEKLTWAMDVFSAGCVIAQLFLETELFTLSQLYKYRNGEYDPTITALSVIPDKDVREMISHMIQRDPEKRYSAEQYLEFWRSKVFPDYFYNFLHQYMGLVTDPSSGNNFDKIAYFLGYQDDKRASQAPPVSPKLALEHFPDDGTLIFVTLVVSSIRNTARAASKIRACDVLLAFAERLTDEAKLDRVLPYLVSLLLDKADIVVISAIRSITQLLQMVRVVTPINAHVFVEYVLPRFQSALYSTSAHKPSPSPLVSGDGGVAQGDGSFTVADPEVEPGAKAEAAFGSLFDNAQRQLFELFEFHAKALVEDSDVYVRRAFLTSVPELCVFFGPAEANDILLAHLNTYLNDRDWMLKCAFFEAIVGIAALVGTSSLEDFILPLMTQALTDTEEFVVQAALHSLAQLANLGLLSRAKTWLLVDVIGRFTMHPNLWIREAAADFLACATKYLNPADIHCIVLPMVRPYLKPGVIPRFTELELLDALQRPLPRSVFEQALVWAAKSDKGMFWKPLNQLRNLAFTTLTSRSSRDLTGHGGSARLSKLKERSAAAAANGGGAGEAEPVAYNEAVSLQSLGITPQTVFFDEKPLLPGARRAVTHGPEGARKKAALNAHKSRGSSNTASPHPHDRRALSPLGAGAGAGAAGGRRDSRESARRIPLLVGRLLSGSPVEGAVSVAGGDDDNLSVSDAPYASRRVIRSQSSALSLLDRKDSNKTIAETSTTETNAFGRVEGPFAQVPSHRTGPASDTLSSTPGSASAKVKANHSYQGNDPSILKMLDNMYVDNYPHDIIEFGPVVQPIARKKIRVGGQLAEPWRPASRLVATFSEHHGPINRVVASPDHVFFVTGGDDGAVKVWDTARLERNISHRSRQTHRHAAGSRVLALCFIENTHCFISCASDGSVHVVKVETTASSAGSMGGGGAVRYPKLRLLREYQLPAGEHAVWVEHFKADTNSVMVLATNRSRVLGIDLRTMTLLYVLENPVHHGAPTCFCVDRRRNWLCLGTSHGVLDLWDLRFKMRLKGWGIPGGGSIYRLCIHPLKGRGRWGVRAMAVGTALGEDSRDVRHAFIVTGGSDKKLRYWDLSRMENSVVYSGLHVDEARPSFAASHPTAALTLNTERIGGGGGAHGHPQQQQQQQQGNGKSKGKAARSTVISMEQQQLLRSHLDAILDVALLESPYTMTVSVDRLGVVFVFQ
ncbi:unnamed protein product [Parascedosporium putredinis]|uniref:non-specific serine/threonine protein kinase n=1 Tax=Parascedosporium putredinis TaxID=1442378 RepID=A0A9P1H516_9PEZI|nr:unnamed protein product [Parascedosporium putredinis]CAI7998809.1 unnamed protein product [Parascedosporium putredinis]